MQINDETVISLKLLQFCNFKSSTNRYLPDVAIGQLYVSPKQLYKVMMLCVHDVFAAYCTTSFFATSNIIVVTILWLIL